MKNCQSTFKLLSEALSNASFQADPNHGIYEIRDEYVAKKKTTEANLFFFRQHFGEGKSTFGQSCLTEGDMFISQTQKQSKKNQEEFHDLHPGKDSIRILGFDYMFGNIEDEKKKHVPNHIQNLWKNESQIISEILDCMENHETPSEAITEWEEDNPDKNPEILNQWRNQFKEETWKNNVIFACAKRIELLNRRAFLKTMDKVMVDEGIEETFVENQFRDFGHESWKLGAEQLQPRYVNPDGEDYMELLESNFQNDEIKDLEYFVEQQVDFEEYEPEVNSLDKEDLDKARAAARKILLQVFADVADKDEDKGMTNHMRNLTGWTDEINPSPSMDTFSELWKKVAKRRQVSGVTSLQEERHALREKGDLQKLKRLNRMTSTMEKIWSARYNRLKYKKEEGKPESIELKKPIYYELWDFIDKANCEVWVLDATTGKDYYEHLFKKYRMHRSYADGEFRDLRVNPEYLGEGNNAEVGDIEIEFEDKSYDKLHEDADVLDNVDYEWKLWDWNVKAEDRDYKASVSKSQTGDNRFTRALVRRMEKEAEDKKVGVVSTKKFKVSHDPDGVKIQNFAQATGSNEFKKYDKLYVIGHPPLPKHWQIEETYWDQYREVPDWNPMNEENDMMRRTSDNHGGLCGFRDRAEKIEMDEGIAVDSRIVNTGTMWEDWFNRNIEQGVFDAMFRIRPDLVQEATVIRIGGNPEGFFEQPDGRASDVIQELDDREVIENWKEMPKSLFDGKDYVTKRGKLKKGVRIWNELRDDYSVDEIDDMTQKEIAEETEVGKRSIQRYQKGWEKLDLL